jgi:hypothetical protein
VTQNPDVPGKIFIHREQSGGILEDLLFNVKVESDGSWTVYDPSGAGGVRSFGRRLGSIERPPRVVVGQCTCI